MKSIKTFFESLFDIDDNNILNTIEFTDQTGNPCKCVSLKNGVLEMAGTKNKKGNYVYLNARDLSEFYDSINVKSINTIYFKSNINLHSNGPLPCKLKCDGTMFIDWEVTGYDLEANMIIEKDNIIRCNINCKTLVQQVFNTNKTWIQTLFYSVNSKFSNLETLIFMCQNKVVKKFNSLFSPNLSKEEIQSTFNKILNYKGFDPSMFKDLKEIRFILKRPDNDRVISFSKKRPTHNTKEIVNYSLEDGWIYTIS